MTPRRSHLRNPRQWIRPFAFTPSVADISLDDLSAAGVSGIIVDLDNTLVGWGHLEPAPRVAQWVANAGVRGFQVAIVSNNSRAWVRKIADALNIKWVHNALKPLPVGIFKALKLLGTHRGETVVIGDQLFTDVLAAKMLGIRAIMTDPVVAREHRAMWPLRIAEKFMLLGARESLAAKK